MQYYKDSDYALNKYSEGIVYKFADRIVEVTQEDYLRANPDKTEEDFAEIKALSDEIYYQQDRQEHRTNRKNVSISGMEDCIGEIPALDMELIREGEEKKAMDAAKRLLESGELTQIQKRRFLLHFFRGLSTRQIARLEGVRQQTIWESLYWAGKKLKKFYDN
ncbi:MAG: RNA polymerase subunit sigma-24 [Lachnospiraceae bacterium]|nr:RNA polymerase subunit sigma-24 [Lachnospiraceae bacterium]